MKRESLSCGWPEMLYHVLAEKPESLRGENSAILAIREKMLLTIYLETSISVPILYKYLTQREE
jgi:hypothetical protein